MQPIIVYLIGFILFCLIVLFFNYYRDKTFDYLSHCHKKVSGNFFWFFIFILVSSSIGYCIGGLILCIIFGVLAVIIVLYTDHMRYKCECKRIGGNLNPNYPIRFEKIGGIVKSDIYNYRFYILYKVYPYALWFKNCNERDIESIFDVYKLKDFLDSKYKDKFYLDTYDFHYCHKCIIKIYSDIEITIEELEKEVNEEYFRVKTKTMYAYNKFKQEYEK